MAGQPLGRLADPAEKPAHDQAIRKRSIRDDDPFLEKSASSGHVTRLDYPVSFGVKPGQPVANSGIPNRSEVPVLPVLRPELLEAPVGIMEDRRNIDANAAAGLSGKQPLDEHGAGRPAGRYPQCHAVKGKATLHLAPPALLLPEVELVRSLRYQVG